jgi:hypothetical protein
MMNTYRWKVLVAGLTYVIMVVMNALANILPINNLTTGVISDSYPNLFAPTGLTFAVWGVIYLGLAVLLLLLWLNPPVSGEEALTNRLLLWLTISNLLNSVWILAWHYLLIGYSLLLMLGILGALMISHLSVYRISHTDRIYWIRQIIDIYFGWITIATIANVTTFLVAINWNRFGLGEDLWMIVMLLIGGLITAVVIVKDRSISYGLVIAWALFGIFLKHVSPVGFNQQYPSVVLVTLLVLVVVLLATLLNASGIIRRLRDYDTRIR